MSTSNDRAVTVVGAGDMGHGFALHFGAHGKDVTLTDHRQSNLDEAVSRIEDVAAFLAGEGWIDRSPSEVLASVEFTPDRAAAAAGADLVLETVPEDLDLKRDVFESVVAEAPDDALLASNTSGIPIGDIASRVPAAAGRMVGCHWWYPPYLLRPVEVVRGPDTSDATVDRLTAFLESVDRDPVLVERDVPGFVWNRVQAAVVRECLHLVEEGVASVADVNRAIRDGYAVRTAAIGPFETMDVAGLELFETVSADLFPHLCDDDAPGPLFRELIEEGRGGIRDGAGFLDYDASADEVTRRRDERVLAVSAALTRTGRNGE
jgi:3-hydroxyacyl-CoA dehydrogenase